MRVVLLLLLAGLAGCIGESNPDSDDTNTEDDEVPALSKQIYEIADVEERFVEASDGTRLHQAIYRPITNESVPVFINFSPYWGNTAENRGDAFGQYMIDEYVPRGYAVVLSAVRGTGHSAGCFEVASDREAMDLYDVVDHFANEPWSNGKILAGGKSYDSTSQNAMIAKFPHDSLVGIFHVSGISDMYRYNYREGVTYTNGLIFTPNYAATYGRDGTHPDGEPLGTVDALGCQEMAEHVASGTGSAASGLKDPYWVERDWNRYIGDSTWPGSIFFVHGFQDWNVKPDHILPWLTELPDQVRTKVWLHQDTYNLGHVYPMRDDWNNTMLRWMDHEAKGIDTGLYAEPTYQLEGSDGIWRESDVWPPETVDYTEANRPDYGEAFRLSGQASITATVTPLHEDAVFTANLYDVPAGSTSGTWVSTAVLRLVYADGLDNPMPYPVGLPMTITAEFFPFDHVFAEGHEWYIDLGAAPGKGILLTPAQQNGLQYGSWTAHLPEMPLDGAMEPQPPETDCFAC